MKYKLKPISLIPYFKIPENEKSMHVDIHSVDPLYFYTSTDEDANLKVKISSIAKRDYIQDGKDTILKYICNVEMYNRRMQCEIQFNINSMIWYLKVPDTEE